MGIGHKEEVFYHEGGEALKQVLQSCGCPMIGSVQGRVGQDFEQPGLLKDIPAHDRRVGRFDL